MRRKQWLALAAAVCLSLSLTACGSDSAVYVQSVEVLAGMSGIAPGERFAGLVVSENVTEIEKDSEKNIEEVYVKSGDDVKKGQKLTGGSIVPQVMLSVCGSQELQRYLVNEIQTVYRSQGVEINDKHIEIIIRQMMQKIRITEQGGTQFLAGEQVDKYDFQRANDEARAKGLRSKRGTMQ